VGREKESRLVSYAEDFTTGATLDTPLRQTRARGRTVSIKRTSKLAMRRGSQLANALLAGLDARRPARGGECVQGENAQRPCPFVSCRWHLYLDVSPRSGAIKLNFPHLEVWEMNETCALDVAARGGMTLEDTGAAVNLTRERIRQLETKGMDRLRACAEIARAAELAGVVDTHRTIPEHAATQDRAGLLDDIATHLYLPGAATNPSWMGASGMNLEAGALSTGGRWSL